MSSKMSYAQFKAVYSQFCEDMRRNLFVENGHLHGWTEEEFFRMFDSEYSKTHQQFLQEFDENNNEETYDITIQPPSTLQ